jgi:hypothetical protein
VSSPRSVVDALLRENDPSADVAMLKACSRRLETIAARTEAAGAAFSRAHARTGVGGLREGTDTAVRVIVGPHEGAVADVVSRLEALAGVLDRYADEVVDIRNRLSLTSAIAERDLVRAEVASLVGHPTALVAAAGAATVAFGAVGEDAVERATNLDPGSGHRLTADGRAAHEDQPVNGQDPAAHAPLLSGAAMPAMLAAAPVAAAMAGASPRGLDGPVAVDEAGLAERVRELQASLPPEPATWVRMSVGVGCAPSGEMIEVVGTSDPIAYLRAGVSVGAGEQVAGSARGSEFAVTDHLAAIGARPLVVASAHPVPAHVGSRLDELGVRLIAPSYPVGDYEAVSHGAPDTDEVDG